MGRRHGNRQSSGKGPRDDFEVERTLAAAEEDGVARADDAGGLVGADLRCTCGSNEFLLEAYLHVVDGRPAEKILEVETLSCPQCGREYEAVQTEDGRVLRGEFVGNIELDD